MKTDFIEFQFRVQNEILKIWAWKTIHINSGFESKTKFPNFGHENRLLQIPVSSPK